MSESNYAYSFMSLEIDEVRSEKVDSVNISDK